ncbi:MAG: 50S ribosomal protein L4 [bacterium]|nr:50S ribosomal protein L4 [bacterium]
MTETPKTKTKKTTKPTERHFSIYNLEGKKVSQTKIEEDVFGIKPNTRLIHQAVICQLSNARQANANTKTRGQVRGGGVKPWKQKGTGRARAGSSNSPIWIGGGIVFGPSNERNYSMSINKKMKHKAILMALTSKAADDKLIVVGDLEIKEPKTQILVQFLSKLPSKANTVLIICPETNTNLELAAANIPYVKLIKQDSINIVDILKYDYILSSKEGLKSLVAKLMGAIPEESKVEENIKPTEEIKEPEISKTTTKSKKPTDKKEK